MLPEEGALLQGLTRTASIDRLQVLRNKIRFDEPLSNHTTLGVGGEARYYCTPESTEELADLIGFCHRCDQPYRMLGAGSNILFADRGYPGMVICTERLRGSSFVEESARVYAGESLARLLDTANHNGVRSLNFLAGIPGSLGGAITMNAGIRQQSISALVMEVAAIDPVGNVRILQQRDCEFAYRQSIFRTQHMPVLWARLRLDGESYDPEVMRAQRLAHQPVFARSAGCVFKNPPGGSAGRLIDEAGLRGTRVGMAKVSEKHANFILNLGGATSAEIRKIIDIVRQKVYKSFRILLEPEIEVIDG
ncbi:MAG TPA: UDP-N-acetylmuramate dehydrogenase [Candidatus Heimdallarchaeota archaeon]|nr:UDP-N-acetylmuramate dehydrogenase [Candidatus Heimdallarchaeota archaeon]